MQASTAKTHMTPDSTHAITRRAETLQSVNSLDAAEREILLARVKAVQGWGDGYAKALGKRRAAWS